MARIGEVVSKTTGAFIGLYKIAGSMSHYAVYSNGIKIKEFSHIGDANRFYNALAK